MTTMLAPPRTDMPGDRISAREFNAIRELVYARFGINLGDHKKSLVVGRLQKVLTQRGFHTFQEYYDWLKNDSSEEGLSELANRITTNHTFFNREPAHFEYFADKLLPQLAAARRAEGRKDPRAWFVQQRDGNLRVNDEIRSGVSFRRHNLMTATFPFKHQFDAIFCRNVMICFDHRTRMELVSTFHQHTAPGGHLFIGHSETLGRDETACEYVMPAYRKRA